MSGNRTYLEYVPDLKELEAIVRLAKMGVQPLELFAKEIQEVVEAKAHVPKSRKYQREFHAHAFTINFAAHLRKQQFRGVEIERDDDDGDLEETKSLDDFGGVRGFELKRLKTLHSFELYGQQFIAELGIPKLQIFTLDEGGLRQETLRHEKRNMERVLNELSMETYGDWVGVLLRSLGERSGAPTPQTSFQQRKSGDPGSSSAAESELERVLAKQKIAYWFPY